MPKGTTSSLPRGKTMKEWYYILDNVCKGRQVSMGKPPMRHINVPMFYLITLSSWFTNVQSHSESFRKLCPEQCPSSLFLPLTCHSDLVLWATNLDLEGNTLSREGKGVPSYFKILPCMDKFWPRQNFYLLPPQWPCPLSYRHCLIKVNNCAEWFQNPFVQEVMTQMSKSRRAHATTYTK